MAISKFIPTVWSETLLSELDQEYIGVRNCNRAFEGEIRGKGSVVKIVGVNNVTVFDYTKDTDMSAPQALTDFEKALTINQAKAFNFQLDDIDKTQGSPVLMKTAMKQAAAALSDEADKYVYSLHTEATEDNTITVATLTANNIVDNIISARKMLLKNKVNSNVPTCLEVSPEVAALIIKSRILSGTNAEDVIENGSLGKFIGFDIYVSPNIEVDDSGYYKCFARTKRAFAFAEQLSEVEAYRPESRFADAVKGLHLYGAKLVYPKEFVLFNVKV